VPRAGRSLELLVHGLEQLLAKTPVEIRSPDYITGKNTKIRREVDVSLRSQVGSVDVLVIIECRDRGKSQGGTWIEQLASKREDVGANKAVAVSATGFSPGARNLARAKQVDLRSLEELEADVVFDWLHAQTVEHRSRHVDLAGASIDLSEQVTEIDSARLASILESIDRMRIPHEGLRQDDRIFVHKADLSMVSIDDILIMMPDSGARFDARFPDLLPGEKRRTILTIGFGDEPKFAVPIPSGLHDINLIAIEGYFYYDERPVPIRRYLYRTDSGTITENAEVTIGSEESRVTLGFHATPDGSTLGLSVRSTGDPLTGGIDLAFEVTQPVTSEG
jgi:Restriction endonuclease